MIIDRTMDLSKNKIHIKKVYRNPSPARIYEWAVMHEEGRFHNPQLPAPDQRSSLDALLG